MAAAVTKLSERFWKCKTCDYLNDLFDVTCNACKTEQTLEDFTPQLIQLGLSCVPAWSSAGATAADCSVSVLTGGFSNRLFRMDVKGAANKSGVIRIFNPRMALSPAQHAAVFAAYSASTLGAAMFGAFEAGHVEEFIEGDAVTDLQLLGSVEDVRCVARALAKVHAFEREALLFDMERDHLEQRMCRQIEQVNKMLLDSAGEHWLMEMIDDDVLKAKSDGTVSERLSAVWEFTKRQLDEACHDSGAGLAPNESVFTHADLHSANLLRLPRARDGSDDSGGDRDDHDDGDYFKVIDYEFSCLAPRVFDLGNFINELYINN